MCALSVPTLLNMLKNKCLRTDLILLFTDLWHDPSDGVEAYLKMKQYEPLLPGARLLNWIENTLLHYL